jgi:predicted nucleotidyltransferase
MVSRASIEEISAIIAREFAPERIILFGSHAYGVPDADSDVDLLVIMPHGGRRIETAVAIRRTFRARFPVDILVRDAEEIRRRIGWGDEFLEEVMERGEVMHESTDDRVGAQSGR